MTATPRRLPLVISALLLFSGSVFAHQLDEYLQATLVAIEPTGIRLQLNLAPGVAVAEQVLALIDRDGDGVISTAEAAAYTEVLKHDLILRLDGRNLELKPTVSNFPEPEELRTGFGIIQIEFTATPGSPATGANTLTLQNRHLPTIGAYLVNAAQPKSGAVQIIAQKRNVNQSMGEIAFSIQPAPASSLARAAGKVVMLAAPLVAVFSWARRKRKSSSRSEPSAGEPASTGNCNEHVIVMSNEAS